MAASQKFYNVIFISMVGNQVETVAAESLEDLQQWINDYKAAYGPNLHHEVEVLNSISDQVKAKYETAKSRQRGQTQPLVVITGE